ncbi:hypothetical protein WA158_006403 [Blastocystis sp. Blastoise]
MIHKKAFVFVHVSDLHLQVENTQVTERFDEFLKDILPQINPDAVILTGDICNSITSRKEHEPIEEEWMLYSTLLKRYGRFDPSFWMDIRGNHDTWDERDSGPLYYKNHSVYGYYQKGSIYQQTYSYSYGSIRFIGLEGCKESAHCFNGRISSSTLTILEDLLMDTSYSSTILFCHFPLMTLDCRALSKYNHNIHDMLSLYKPTAFLGGHIHSQFGMNPNFVDSHGVLELYIPDFKQTGIFRLFTLFEGILSWEDYSIPLYHNKPLLCLCSPSDCRYLVPSVSLLSSSSSLSTSSTSITLFAVAKYSIEDINIKISNKVIKLKKQREQKHLYTCSVDKSSLSSSQLIKYLSLEIEVLDKHKQRTRVNHPITVDNTSLSPSLSLLGYLLKLNLSYYMIPFSLLVIIFITILSILSIYISFSITSPYTSSYDRYTVLNQYFYSFFSSSSSISIFIPILVKWLLFHGDSSIALSLLLLLFFQLFIPHRTQKEGSTYQLLFWWGNYNITTHHFFLSMDNLIWSTLTLWLQYTSICVYCLLFYTISSPLPFIIQLLQLGAILYTSTNSYIALGIREKYESSDFLCTYTDEIRPFILIFIMIKEFLKNYPLIYSFFFHNH